LLPKDDVISTLLNHIVFTLFKKLELSVIFKSKSAILFGITRRLGVILIQVSIFRGHIQKKNNLVYASAV